MQNSQQIQKGPIASNASLKHHKPAIVEYRQTSRTNKYWYIKPQIKYVTI